MSHLHVVDGVLPWWVVGASLVIAALAVLGVLRLPAARDSHHFLARVGVAGAALIVVMSLPLGPGLHLSLAPLTGMMLGPAAGFLAAFLANAFLAAMGHGGLTALGVNGLFLGAQAVTGALLFSAARRVLGVRGGAVAATAATLLLAAAGALLALEALPLEAAHAGHDHGHAHDHGHEHAAAGPGWGTIAVAAAALVVAAVETWLSTSVIVFLARVRSDLVHGGGSPRPRSAAVPA